MNHGHFVYSFSPTNAHMIWEHGASVIWVELARAEVRRERHNREHGRDSRGRPLGAPGT